MSVTAGEIALCASLAAVLTAAPLLVNLRDGFPQADEGYLWYGTVRAAAGDVPIRDFRGYEPGRYRWCAWFLGDRRGIVALRVAVHAFFVIGVLAGLAALRVDGLGWPAVVLAAVVVAIWAYPAHKLFEPALGLAGVLAATALIADPGPATAVAAGLIAGLSAWLGVNYALYLGAALLGVSLLAAIRAPDVDGAELVAAFAVGGTVGAVPLALSFARSPGLWKRFVERRVHAVLARGTANLPLPVPWPWRPTLPAAGVTGRAGGLALGLLFAMVPVFAVGVSTWAVVAPWDDVGRHPALAGAAIVTLAAMHHAFSRADLSHLAQCMPVVGVGLVALGGDGARLAAVALALLMLSLLTVGPAHPAVRRRRRAQDYALGHVRGHQMWLSAHDHLLFNAVAQALGSHAPDRGDPILAVPTLAALLPVLDRRSAVYDTFCVYPASTAEQRAMLRSLTEEDVRVAVIHDLALDGREELRFRHTHPLVWAELERSFRRVPIAGLPGDYHLLVR